jgi:CheY-like chemotaxis protein
MAKKILIVDDKKEIVLAMQEFLDEQGFRTAVALSGSDALSQCRNETFDLMLTDVMLPDLDGRVLVEKCLELLPALKIIFVTAYTNNLKVKSGAGLQVLKKPCRPSAILEKIEDMLQ